MQLKQRRQDWSTILLPTKVRLILELWRYIDFCENYYRIHSTPGKNGMENVARV